MSMKLYMVWVEMLIHSEELKQQQQQQVLATAAATANLKVGDGDLLAN